MMMVNSFEYTINVSYHYNLIILLLFVVELKEDMTH